MEHSSCTIENLKRIKQVRRRGCCYFSSKKDQNSKRRYLDKLCAIGVRDPYETERKEWKDDIDLLPSINFGMHLLVTPSSYSEEDLIELQELGLL